MKCLPIYQVDAFTQRLFGGNPAAIIPLDAWLPDESLLAIAAENNLSETAFICKANDADYRLRWFTPAAEVELCGHATLATAWWLFEHGNHVDEYVSFNTLSGVLRARRIEDGVEIDLPTRASVAAEDERVRITAALNKAPTELRRGANWIAIFDDAETIRSLTPDFRSLRELHPLGLIVTAPGDDCDFVSRYFAPSYGIDEDPVTGSAHADLAPYWAHQLGKSQLRARQLSLRGGELGVTLDGDRVKLAGQCQLYLRGEILVPS